MTLPRVYIDGEAGTTGLQIRTMLESRNDLDLLRIDPEKRKDPLERQKLLNSADVAVLCLHDDLAREAVGMISNPHVRVLDASTAHRVADGWVYGFPELEPNQAKAIHNARFVANPGCYAQNAIALLRPLVDAGLIPADHPLNIQGVQGYSGGGRQLIDAAEGHGTHHLAGGYRAYGLSLDHKHLPEMMKYSRLTTEPIFTPAVGKWFKGMLVQIPLHLHTLPKRPSATDFQVVLEQHYAGQQYVRVLPLEQNAAATEVLDPETLNNTNLMEIKIFANPKKQQALLVARADNLGKGASGAAVQNLSLMLGLPHPA
ncbi:MAG: N-acetyl-gamma-glutamyl-phosphate reductase [Deinococcales bacterium]